MKHGSLFSGIGGFDLAAEWMGWENVFHCEIAEFPRKVLHYHFPEAISYDDIKRTDFTIHRGEIDILTGGFPCQPFSVAGKRQGTEDDRYLWTEMFRAIRELAPRWIVGENVRGIVSWNEGMVFDQVQSDLEAEGYEVWPIVLPACSVNAPHRRDRVWIVAHSGGFRCGRGSMQADGYDTAEEQSLDKEKRYQWDGIRSEAQGCSGDAADTNHEGLQRGEINGGVECIGEERKEQFTRYIPSTWEDFPTQPPVCGGDDGIPRELDSITFSKWRIESVKALGNAIVPQVVYQIFKAVEAYETHHQL